MFADGGFLVGSVPYLIWAIHVFGGNTRACPSYFRADLISEVNSSGGRLTLVARQPGTRRSSC